MLYEKLLDALKATGVPFTEFSWASPPSDCFGVVALDGEADAVHADDKKIDRALEGTVDFYSHAQEWEKMHAIEDAMRQLDGVAWRLESVQYEEDTRLIHREWVFQLERD